VLILFLPLKSKIWPFLAEALFLSLAAIIPLIGFQGGVLYGFTLMIYPLSMAILLPFFMGKYCFTRALSLTLCLGFLLTGLHEFWGFIRLDLGLYDNILALQSYHTWFTPLDHLYYLVIAILSLWISRFQKVKALGLFGWFLFGLALEWIIYPHLALNLFGPYDVARRLLWLPILMIIFYYGGKTVLKHSEERGYEKC
jgi:hypothetical protein